MNTKYHKIMNFARAFNKWFIPYIRSRIYHKEFRPLLSYLFTEWKCNIDCHYCWDFNSTKEGMTLETAKDSIDWIYSTGCRVVAIMGGEPLIRPDFIVDVIKYGAKKGMFMYLPTNGFLMTEKFIDRIGKAGVAAVNLAVDCIAPKPGMPKAFTRIEPQFRHLVKQQKKYGYVIFLNINITSRNLKDVKKLTEIAKANGIGTDYHMCEPPLLEHRHRKNKGDDFYIKKHQLKEFDRLIDWLVEKNKNGYAMINSRRHLIEMKNFARNKTRKWGCRAGINSSFICADGSVKPCFEMMCSSHDWGRIWKPKFDREKLMEMKKECRKHCLSTCQYTLGYYYNPSVVMKWIVGHGRIS